MQISLAMPVEAVQLILAALNELPMKTSRVLHDSIQAETQRQITEAQKPAKKPKAPKAG